MGPMFLNGLQGKKNMINTKNISIEGHRNSKREHPKSVQLRGGQQALTDARGDWKSSVT